MRQPNSRASSVLPTPPRPPSAFAAAIEFEPSEGPLTLRSAAGFADPSKHQHVELFEEILAAGEERVGADARVNQRRRVDYEAIRQPRHARKNACRYAKITQNFVGESVGVLPAKLGQEIAIGNGAEHARRGTRPQPERREPPLAVVGIARERAVHFLDAILACEVIWRQNREDARAAFEGIVHLRHKGFVSEILVLQKRRLALRADQRREPDREGFVRPRPRNKEIRFRCFPRHESPALLCATLARERLSF